MMQVAEHGNDFRIVVRDDDRNILCLSVPIDWASANRVYRNVSVSHGSIQIEPDCRSHRDYTAVEAALKFIPCRCGRCVSGLLFPASASQSVVASAMAKLHVSGKIASFTGDQIAVKPGPSIASDHFKEINSLHEQIRANISAIEAILDEADKSLLNRIIAWIERKIVITKIAITRAISKFKRNRDAECRGK